MILPLGLFLGILLAYGRLYMDSEMTVLTATGMSQQRLMLYSLAPALLVALLVAWLSLGLTPKGAEQADRILNDQDSLTEFDTLEAGRFQKMRNSDRVTYVESLTKDRTELGGVFISEKRRSEDGTKERGITVLVANSGRQEIHPDGSRYLILEDGYRYDGTPGGAEYRVTKYDAHGVLMPKAEVNADVTDREALSTRALIDSNKPRLKIELQWRLSLPILVFVITLLAVPLSRVNPRQGRFLKLLPAILLYMAYLALLIAVRGALLRLELGSDVLDQGAAAGDVEHLDAAADAEDGDVALDRAVDEGDLERVAAGVDAVGGRVDLVVAVDPGDVDADERRGDGEEREEDDQLQPAGARHHSFSGITSAATR